MLCRYTLGLILFFALLWVQPALTQGTQDGGGGSEEAKTFMTVARAKVMLLIGNPKTNKFGLQLLETIESRPKVIIVPSLAGTCDGKAIVSYYAYSCTGQINLVRSVWGSKKDGGQGWLETTADADWRWADILHELARASDKSSKKFVTDDEGYSETTKPEVVEAINRGSGISIDVITPSETDVKKGLLQYIQTVPQFNLGDSIIETPWVRVNPREWLQIRSPEAIARETVFLSMKQKVKDEFKLKMASVIRYETMAQCQDGVTAKKAEFQKKAVYGSYYSRRVVDLDVVPCAEDAPYVKGRIQIYSQLKNWDQDFLQYLIGLHIQRTSQDLIASLQEFVRGLGAIEVNPVISADRYAAFGIKSGSEMYTWMDFYLGRVRLALAYAKFVDRLNLGYEVKSIVYNLRLQAVGALRKLNQFEDPAIYIVQIDYENGSRPTITPVFELSQMRALVQVADVGLPLKGPTVIRNRSRVEAAGFVASVAVSLRCDEISADLFRKADTGKVIDKAIEFKDSADYLLTKCRDRFIYKDQTASAEEPWRTDTSQEQTQEIARQMAIELLREKPEMPGCIAYEVQSSKDHYISSYSLYMGRGFARLKWVCSRPSTNVN